MFARVSVPGNPSLFFFLFREGAGGSFPFFGFSSFSFVSMFLSCVLLSKGRICVNKKLQLSFYLLLKFDTRTSGSPEKIQK